MSQLWSLDAMEQDTKGTVFFVFFSLTGKRNAASAYLATLQLGLHIVKKTRGMSGPCDLGRDVTIQLWVIYRGRLFSSRMEPEQGWGQVSSSCIIVNPSEAGWPFQLRSLEQAARPF